MSRPADRVGARVKPLRRSARLERARGRAPRVLFVAATLILAAVGARALTFPAEAPTPPAVGVGADHASEDFAQGFARAYLTNDPHNQGARERRLRALAPDQLDLAGALALRERQHVRWTQIAQNQEAIAGGRVIVVAAGVSTQPDPLYLAVPVARDGEGSIALAGYPALVGPPSISNEPLVERDELDDEEIAAVARRALANYLAAETDDLSADLAAGTEVSLPSRQLRVLSVEETSWADGVGSSAVLVTVIARDAERATWTLTYELGIDAAGARPYVTFIETVPNAP